MQPRAGEVGLTWIDVRLVPMSPRLTWERKVCTEGGSQWGASVSRTATLEQAWCTMLCGSPVLLY